MSDLCQFQCNMSTSFCSEGNQRTDGNLEVPGDRASRGIPLRALFQGSIPSSPMPNLFIKLFEVLVV